jgi:hypothetical protein
MSENSICGWYDKTSGMKWAYDHDKLDISWIEKYCWNSGKGCVRKQRFETEGCVSPDHVLPDGNVDQKLKKWIEGKD